MICKPENSDFHRSFGGHHCLGLTNPDVNLKRMHKLYNYQEMRQITDQLMAPRELKRHTTPTGAHPGFLERGFNSYGWGFALLILPNLSKISHESENSLFHFHRIF